MADGRCGWWMRWLIWKEKGAGFSRAAKWGKVCGSGGGRWPASDETMRPGEVPRSCAARSLPRDSGWPRAQSRILHVARSRDSDSLQSRSLCFDRIGQLLFLTGTSFRWKFCWFCFCLAQKKKKKKSCDRLVSCWFSSGRCESESLWLFVLSDVVYHVAMGVVTSKQCPIHTKVHFHFEQLQQGSCCSVFIQRMFCSNIWFHGRK